MNIDEKLKIDILLECKEDYVGLWYLIDIVKDHVRPIEKYDQNIVLEIISILLQQGFIAAGLPTRDGKFIIRQGSADELIQYIKQKWNTLGHEPNIGDVIWFDITDKGKQELEKTYKE